MGSRSEKELDEWEMILDTSFSETKKKKLSMVGVFLGRIWGDETVEEDFKAEYSLTILSEKKLPNICDSDWEEAKERSRGEGLSSRRVRVDGIPKFEEEDAIREALKRYGDERLAKKNVWRKTSLYMKVLKSYGAKFSIFMFAIECVV